MAKTKSRVLTYAEMKQLKYGKWIWIETQEINSYSGGLYHLQLIRDAKEVKDDEYENYINLELGGPKYDIHLCTNDCGWRIWTSKPSNRVMKNQKWPTYTCNDCEYCDKENNRCKNYKIPLDHVELTYIDFDFCCDCEYYRYNPLIVY